MDNRGKIQQCPTMRDCLFTKTSPIKYTRRVGWLFGGSVVFSGPQLSKFHNKGISASCFFLKCQWEYFGYMPRCLEKDLVDYS